MRIQPILARARKLQRGFTLIELIIVLAIMSILLALAVPRYNAYLQHSREAALRDDLFQLRSLIDQYTLDKQQAPQSLQDLVTAGYLRQLPVDPMTGKNTTWQAVTSDDYTNPDEEEPGIIDVHSGSDGVGSDGTAYNTW